MLRQDGKAHRRLRSLVNKAFAAHVIKQMRSYIQEIAAGLLDGVVHQGEMDLVANFAFPLPTIVISELLGISVENHNQFRAYSDAIVTSDRTPSVLALLQHSQQLPLLRQDPRLVLVAIEELLRYNGAADHSTNLYAIEDVEIEGQFIRQANRACLHPFKDTFG